MQMLTSRKSLATRVSFFAAGALFGGLGGSAQNAEDFFLAHDEQVFVVDPDLGAGIFAEENAVAFLDGERENLALVIALAFADGDNHAFLRLFLVGVRNDDAGTVG